MTKRTTDLIQRIVALGFQDEEAWQLRRIEMTLHRWAEQECGDQNDHCSWSIERDEKTNKPFRVTYPHKGNTRRREAIADRETGALKRLARIVATRNERWFAPNTEANRISEMPGFVLSYHQTDPRGASVYLLRASDIRPGENLDSVYTRGLAVCE